MHMLSVMPSSVLALLFAWCFLPAAHAYTYLVINDPALGGQWSNGAANHISWTKGLLDGVDTFDIEMSRMSVDGLIYVASTDCWVEKRERALDQQETHASGLGGHRGKSARYRRLPIGIRVLAFSLPGGDESALDVLLLSPIPIPSQLDSLNVELQDVPPADDYYLLFVNSTIGVKYGTSSMFSIRAASNATTTSPDANAPTVTISGSPNPLSVFATTFPPSANGVALPGFKGVQASMPQIFALTMVMVFAMVGGAITVL
ncbi:hypothetical protein EIP91_009536 [Steccherinum ochraceum]|uniref:Uncharacterized protein n=1 Tax=Steccherinum ochraceum TaxID=92696 RepID=A0A4V2MV23_9APHY|nr:hypothetical protein EIP91_009536 [Steccherinum ochraceum]